MSKRPGRKMPMYPNKEPPMLWEREGEGREERARKPRAREKLKLGPGNACLYESVGLHV